MKTMKPGARTMLLLAAALSTPLVEVAPEAVAPLKEPVPTGPREPNNRHRRRAAAARARRTR